MARQYSSISQETTLTADLSASTSAVTVNVQSAANLMGGITLTGGDTFTVVVDPDTANEEILYVTAVVGNALTVTRAQDSTTVKSHATGAKIRHMAIGEDFRLAETHRNSSTGVHGLATSSAVVGTTDTQTLTNKTISGSSNTLSNIPNSATTATSASTANTIVSRDASGNFSAGTITAAVSGNASTATALQTGRNFEITGDVTASAQTFTGTSNVTLNTAIAAGAIVNADINTSAAIAYSKLNLSDSIVNADVNTSAQIGYGKLNLTNSIDNDDINASAGIELTKLAVNPLARANHTGTQTASTISDFDTQVRTNRLDQMTAPNTSLSINSQKLTNVADPTANQDAVTLKYLNDQKGANNGIASLDSSGLIPSAQLPPLAITDVDVVASQAAMLALTAEPGDIAVRTDVNKSFILTASPASTLGNWQELLTPTDTVLSVDGLTGTVSLSSRYLSLSGGAVTGAIAMGNNKITGLADPTNAQDAVTINYLNNTVLAPSNLTGVITSVGNLTSIASQTGTGSTFVVQNSPTLTTPDIGVATATSINGTVIPTSKTLVATDSTAYVLPSQTGNNGKYLKTNGSVASWESVDLSSYATIATVEDNYIMTLMGAI